MMWPTPANLRRVPVLQPAAACGSQPGDWGFGHLGVPDYALRCPEAALKRSRRQEAHLVPAMPVPLVPLAPSDLEERRTSPLEKNERVHRTDPCLGSAGKHNGQISKIHHGQVS